MSLNFFAIARILRELYRDPDKLEKRLEALQRISNLLVPGYRLTWPNADWWNNEAFNAYLEKTGEQEGLNTLNRMMLAELLRLVHVIPGDTAECGVFRGSTSMLICQANQTSDLNKHHHMFDSFEGVSQPVGEDGSYWSKGDLTCSLEETKKALSEYESTSYYPGWIPERFDEVADREFSFVHIDVDLYEPTRDSIDFFFPKLNPGGILLCDDYGSPFCPGATKACDEYVRDRPESMLALPACGGFLIKGIETGPAFAN